MRKNAIVTKEKYSELNTLISNKLGFDSDSDTKSYAPIIPSRVLSNGKVVLPITKQVEKLCGDIIKDLEYEV